ncbi:hypothetical protein ACFSJF_20315 [Ornithinibacillus salinisoli]|uniref:Uncharacterized protein n=1 Tax=Ornithinibacillus salinisoli TaxID=1848459 RepID=A0ABW4W7W7_9BACI
MNYMPKIQATTKLIADRVTVSKTTLEDIMNKIENHDGIRLPEIIKIEGNNNFKST